MTTLHRFDRAAAGRSDPSFLISLFPTPPYVAFTKGAVDNLLQPVLARLGGRPDAAAGEAWQARIQKANDDLAAAGHARAGRGVRAWRADPRQERVWKTG